MSRVADLVKRTLLGTAYYRTVLRRTRFDGVAVLCYHGVRPDALPAGTMPFESLHVRTSQLEAHCRLIRDTCHPISLDDWRAAVAGRLTLPARPVLMTFDDGYRSMAELARPVLERYGLPAVAFVCSGPVQQQRTFWFDAVARAHGEDAVRDAKALPYPEWSRLCHDRWSDEVHAASAPMTVDQLVELASSPLIEIGAHSVDHPILARADLDVQRDQIEAGKRQLERWIGRAVRAFAYPNGQPGQDYTAETVALVRQAGFDCAFTTAGPLAALDTSPYERSRVVILSDVSEAELAHRLAYSWRMRRRRAPTA